MSEISDVSGSHATMSGDDSVTEGGSNSGIMRTKPPIPTSVAGKYKSAGHLPDEVLFSKTMLLVTSGVSLLIGALVGFLAAVFLFAAP
jgi:hypothetical protein